ncbi:hypothetical protein SAMN04490357_3977 [Streptomyces misionensis]|uniref:Uncharacterized protein n=1 Tax=Streptomyces misionensis TaxID=67331 RepID=A0A1H4YCR4_9ACTN|nr:hypothetical protein [Streptomyces misionensis]SED15637.1 hypothetical protein SAMN04490357_3977 [Streptomyces misionensis]
MTPWLRLTHRSLRLLVVLATALPAYGAATAYAGPGTPHSSTPAAPSPSPSSSTSGHAGSSGDPARPAHDHQDGPGPGPGHEHDGPGPGDPPRPTHAPRPSASSNHPPSGEPSRAGSGAGEGRMRPGRPDGPWAEVEGDDDPVGSAAAQPAEPETAESPTSAASPPPRDAGLDPTGAPRDAARQSENASEPELRILPLGSGLVLIGLGLGLAFLGLRLRRG